MRSAITQLCKVATMALVVTALLNGCGSQDTAGVDAAVLDTPDGGVHAQQWSASIRWDQYGVPTVVGDSLGDLAFGDGYAQARDRLDTMMLNYARARGREAERYGPSCLPACSNRDKSSKMLRAESSALQSWETFSDDEKALVEAFVAGIRYYIDEDPERAGERAQRFPPDAIDVLALSNYTMAGRQFTEATQDMNSGGWVWDGGAGHGGESNGWSVQEGDQVFVQADPHTPWDDFNWLWEHRWFTTDGSFAATGGTTTGLPGFVHAATPHHAWSFTRTGVDRGDCAVVKISQDGTQYLRDGQWRDLEVVTEEILTGQADGSTSVETMDVIMTVDGPIIKQETEGDATIGYVAVLTMLGQARQFIQTIEMAAAENLEQFQAALGGQQISGFQLFYGDRDGENFYAWAGRVYDRTEDPDNPRSWTECQPIWEEGTAFGEIRPFEGMPQSETPQVVGDVEFFQGSNTPNFILEGGAWGIKLADYPGYVHTSVEFIALPARPQRTTDHIVSGGHTSQGMLEWSMDTYVLAAEWTLPALELAVKNHRDGGSKLSSAEEDALALLADWDMFCDLESRQYTLWREFATNVATTGTYLSSIRNSFPDLPEDPSVVSPEKLAQLLEFFEMAVQTVPRDADGTIRPWGEINVIDRETGNIPLGAGGSDTQTMWQGSSKIEARDKSGVSHVSGGSNFMMNTRYDTVTGEVEVWSISAKGQSEHPESLHYDDQTKLYVQRKYKAATLSMEEAMAQDNVELQMDIHLKTVK